MLQADDEWLAACHSSAAFPLRGCSQSAAVAPHHILPAHPTASAATPPRRFTASNAGSECKCAYTCQSPKSEPEAKLNLTQRNNADDSLRSRCFNGRGKQMTAMFT